MKILVPYDGSSYSTNSLEFVASRTTLLGKEPTIRLLLVQQPLPSRAVQLLSPDGVKAYFDEEAEKLLKPARKFFKKNHIAAEEKIVQGDPSEMIAQEAEAFGADLIVMGSRGRTALEGLFLGSVTNGVLARTKHPMLILRGKPAPEADALKVGICVDGSAYGQTAVKFVLKQQALFGRAAKFNLIAVAPDVTNAAMPELGFGLPSMTPEEIDAAEKQTFEEMADTVRPLFEKANVMPKEVMLVGEAGKEIAAYAKKKLDLVVMGSHGYGRFKSAVMGSTAMRVASSGNVPILLIRR